MGKDLAQRVATRAQQQRGGEVAEAGQSIEQYIRSMQEQFALAMPRGVEATQLVRDAITAVRRNPKLALATRETVLGGLMTCAQLGLRVGVLGHAWLLPFRNAGKSRDAGTDVFEAQLIIGYQGYKELAYRSGLIESLIARTVYENDEFDVDYGLADNLIHKPTLKGDRGDPVAYYAIGKTSTGGHAFVVVGRDEMERHRDQHAMARDRNGKVVGPWRDNFDEMAEKTTFLQLSRWLPRSTELASAIEADGSVRVDISPTADVAAVSQTIQGEIVEEAPAIGAGAEDGPPAEPVSTGTEPDATPVGDVLDAATLRRLNTALSKAGHTKRDERLAFVREAAGVEVESTKDLTVEQAAAVFARLDAPAEPGASPSASHSEPSDPVAKPDTLPDTPADDERARLVASIGKAANVLGLSLEDVQRRMKRDYRTDLDTADLSDLSDLLDSLTTGGQK